MMYNCVPHVDLHDLNLDWILCEVKRLSGKYGELAKAVEEIKKDLGAYAAQILQGMLEDGSLARIIEQLNSVKKTYATAVEMMEDDGISSGDFCQTLGFYEKGDGGSCLYMASYSDTDISLQAATEDLYLFPMDVYEKGYIDIRWVGANEEQSISVYLEDCLKYANKHNQLKVKIVGKYFMTSGIEVQGSIALFGEHTINRVLVGSGLVPDLEYTPVSSIEIRGGITAITLKGLGNDQSRTAAYVFMDSLSINGQSMNSGTFLDIKAFGAPSRPSFIKNCTIFSMNKFMNAVWDSSFVYDTCIAQMTIEGNNVFDVNELIHADYEGDTPKMTFTGLSVRNNIIEQGGNAFKLRGLFGYNEFVNNLMETNSNPEITVAGVTTKDRAVIHSINGTIVFKGNYMEQIRSGNARWICDFESSSIWTNSIEIGDQNAINTGDDQLEMTVSNFFVRSVDQVQQNAKYYSYRNCMFAVDGTERPIIDHQSVGRFPALKSVLGMRKRPEIDDGDHLLTGTNPTMINGLPCHSGAFGLGYQAGYTTKVACNVGDYIVLTFWKTDDNLSLTMQNENGQGVNIIRHTVYSDRGWCSLIFRAETAVQRGNIFVHSGTCSDMNCVVLSGSQMLNKAILYPQG